MIFAFVYGTLRVGEYNYRWASGDVLDEITDVTTTGDIYFASDNGPTYPVAKLDGEGTIVGDVLVYPDDSLDWKNIYSMESSAGYELREIDVRVNDQLTIPAVAWHYKHHPRGSKIESGDWAAAYHLSEIS